MDINLAMQAITQVGFPIVMCCAMAWYVKYSADSHKAEMKEVTNALNNNTIALQKLCDRFEK